MNQMRDRLASYVLALATLALTSGTALASFAALRGALAPPSRPFTRQLKRPSRKSFVYRNAAAPL